MVGLKRRDYFHEADIIGIKKIIFASFKIKKNIFAIVVQILAQSEMIPIMVLLLLASWYSNVTFLFN